MQKTTSLPESPAVSAPSAASTNPWLPGATSSLPPSGSAPFPHSRSASRRIPARRRGKFCSLPPRAAAPFPCPCPGMHFPQCPRRSRRPACSHLSEKAQTLFPSLLRKKKTHCSPTQHSLPPNPCPSLSQALHLPQNASGLPPPSPCPCPRRAFPAVPPHNRVRRVSPPLSCSRSLA